MRLGGDALAAIGSGFGHDPKADAISGRTVDTCPFAVARSSCTIASAHVLFELVVRHFDEVFFVLICPRVFTEGEEVTRRNVASIAGAVRYLALGFLLLDAHAGIVLAIAHIGVAARPFIHFPAVFGVACGLLLTGSQLCLGLFEIVIVGFEVSAGNVFGKSPFVDEVFRMYVRSTAFRIVGDGARSIG